MIVWDAGDKQPSQIRWNNKTIVRVCTNSLDVWLNIISCFGRGYWVDDLVWSDTEVWKN